MLDRLANPKCPTQQHASAWMKHAMVHKAPNVPTEQFVPLEHSKRGLNTSGFKQLLLGAHLEFASNLHFASFQKHFCQNL